MKTEKLDCIGYVDAQLIEKAENYASVKERTSKLRFFKNPCGRAMVAAVLAICMVAWGISIFSPFGGMTVTAYAYGTNEEIPAAGAVINTGTISDTGEMKGHPLMFYLSGKGIATVRFSCKNHQIDFVDWTEKRDEYGIAQNFTVPYGENESEYHYLTIDWVPNATIRELTDHAEATIATLPAEMREDIIVMEITFANGKTTVKAIKISLLDDGRFFASFGDYKISDSDDFVRRPDSKAIPRSILYSEGTTQADEKNHEEESTVTSTDNPRKLSDEDIIAAKKAALDYYSHTVFTVNSIEYIEPGTDSRAEGKCNFMVNVSKGGVVQEPDRLIQLDREDGSWKVINEGY
jgi:hypothetical protein